MRMGPLGRRIYTSRLRAALQRRWVLPTMLSLGGGIRGARVVELGAGSGAGARLLRSAGARQVVATDLDERMVDHVRSDTAVAAVLAHSARLPIPDSAADVVVDFCGIHLADDWQSILDEVARVLVPGGRFLLEQPVDAVVKRIPVLRRIGGFDETRLLAGIEKAGLCVTGTARLGHIDLVAAAVKP